MAATRTRRKARDSPARRGPVVLVDPTARVEKTTYAQLLREDARKVPRTHADARRQHDDAGTRGVRNRSGVQIRVQIPDRLLGQIERPQRLARDLGCGHHATSDAVPQL